MKVIQCKDTKYTEAFIPVSLTVNLKGYLCFHCKTQSRHRHNYQETPAEKYRETNLIYMYKQMVKESINYRKKDSYYTCNKTLKITCMKPSTPAMFSPGPKSPWHWASLVTNLFFSLMLACFLQIKFPSSHIPQYLKTLGSYAARIKTKNLLVSTTPPPTPCLHHEY